MSKTWFGRTFNAWFGRNETWVANDSGTEIKATITSQQIDYTIGVKIKAPEASASGEATLKPTDKESWMIIQHGNAKIWYRNSSHDYLTVAMKTDEGDYQVTTCNYPLPANFSFIIDRNGTPDRQKYGSSDLFERM